MKAAFFLLPCVLTAGCVGPEWDACQRAWEDFRCDRRVGVFADLRLDTAPGGRTGKSGGADGRPATTRVADYNRSLVYLHSRRVSEVRFEGRTTAHGTLGEFRALHAGFGAIPDPAYRGGRVKLNWLVKRTYRFAVEDTQGKYHPSTFWVRIFGTPWSDDYVSGSPPAASSSPRLYVLSHFGSRCHVEEVAYVAHADTKNYSKKVTYSWDVVREWDE